MNPELNEEFTWWYERVYLQSPRLASLKYDDEKMWEAWKAGYKLTVKEPQYLYLYEDINGINITSDKNYATKDMEYVGKIKLEVEDDLEL
jgi:hypothetical protein